jgi:hypothetical protein
MPKWLDGVYFSAYDFYFCDRQGNLLDEIQAGLLANAVCQSTLLLDMKQPSRANPTGFMCHTHPWINALDIDYAQGCFFIAAPQH